MSYLSLSFVLFVAVTVLIYYLVPKHMRSWVLLLSSLVFYASNNIFYLIYLLFITAVSFMCARGIAKGGKKRVLLWLSISVSVILWLITRGTLGMINNWIFPLFDIVPLGISYYMFQSIAYVVDVYRQNVKPENNFFKYLLFLSYFPAIVQGPISRYDQLAPQLNNGKKFDFDKFKNSLILVLFGLAKKMVIADNLTIIVDKFFENFDEYKGFILYIAAVCYAFQLYMDFSGCVDICRGVSGLFGIELIDNFASPYFAKSNKEFWNRWHITLSSFLKDYVYIPLGGNRKGKFRKYINLLITFAISGIWHGYGLSFIIWGLLQALYQIIGETTLKLRSKVKSFLCVEENSFSDKFYRTFITFNLTTFAWIFFRSEDLMSALEYIGNMLVPTGILALFSEDLYDAGLNAAGFTVVIVNIIVMLYVDYLKKKNINIIDRINKLHIILRWSVYLLLIFNVILFGAYGSGYDPSGFLYGGY